MPKFTPKATIMGVLATLALLVVLVVSLHEAGSGEQMSVLPAATGLPQAAETRTMPMAAATGADAAQARRPITTEAADEMARRWRVARERYAADKNWVALIQHALAEPTAEGLFYAMHTMQLCEAARTFETMDRPENSPCPLVLEYHQGWGEVYRKQRSLAMASEDRKTLDAILGSGEYRQATPGTLWAVVQATSDPLALAEVAGRWAGHTNATFGGARLSEADSIAFVDAWALAACQKAGNCETSVGAMRLCKHLGQCAGSMVTRLEASMTPEQAVRLRRALASVEAALDSGDFSAFGP